MKKGLSAFRTYYLLLTVFFFFLGWVAISNLSTAYSQQYEHEGIGFSQTALIHSYGQMDSLMLYTQTLSKVFVQQAISDYALSGLFTSTQEGCGIIGIYPAWNSQEHECFPEQNLDPVQGQLKLFLDSTLSAFWDYPLLRSPVSYDYYISQSGQRKEITGRAQENIVIPIIGVRQESVKALNTVMNEELSIERAEFSPDTTLSAISAPSVVFTQRQEEERVTHIVIHNTKTATWQSAAESLEATRKSMHYLVGRTTATGELPLVQLVQEEDVATQLDSCEQCSLNNEQTLAIGIVNLANSDGVQKTTVNVDGSCTQLETHEYRAVGQDCFEEYEEEQLELLANIITDIMRRKGFEATQVDTVVVAYDELQENAHSPGPLLAMDALRSRIVQKLENDGDITTITPAIDAELFSWPSNSKEILCEQESMTIASAGTVRSVGRGLVEKVCTEDCGVRKKHVIIAHENGVVVEYNNLEEVLVEKDQRVARNTPLGEANEAEIIILEAQKEGRVPKDPLCFFSTLSREEVTGCSREPSCKEVAFRGFAKTSCFSPILEELTDHENQKVLATKENMIRYNLNPYITEGANEYGVAESFLKAIITQESLGDIYAISKTGAAGVMQFTYDTGIEQGLEIPRACCTEDEAEKLLCAEPGVAVCKKETDERFMPKKAIPAGAKYLAWQLEQFKEYSGYEQYYFAAQGYNTGADAVKNKIKKCKGQPVITECVRDALKASRGEEAFYAERVMKLMGTYGAGLEEANCQGLSLKNFGNLRFKPHFTTTVNDIFTPVDNLIEQSKALVANTNDNLHEIPMLRFEGGSIEEKSCVDETPFLKTILENIGECKLNGQNECACTVLPEKTLLEDGTYRLSFVQDSFIVLLKQGPTGQGNKARFTRMERFNSNQKFAFYKDVLEEEFEQVDRVNIEFEVRSGFIVSSSVDAGLLKNISDSQGFVKQNGNVQGVVAQKVDACLPTNHLQSYCAQIDTGIAVEGEVKKPVVQFGLHFEDAVAPQSPNEIFVTGDERSLDIHFKPPSNEDISGFMIYCAPRIGEASIFPEKRIIHDGGSGHSIRLTECNGEKLNRFNHYTIYIHSFDYGGNEEDSEQDCVNVATYSYAQEIAENLPGASVQTTPSNGCKLENGMQYGYVPLGLL